MKRQLKIALLLIVGLSAFGCRQPKAMNLLILSVDTLRADALGVAGHSGARTPNIDRLAAEGTFFSTAVSPLPRTTPALGSLHTGLWPHRHGSREVGDPIQDVPTLAEVLAGRGYKTLAVSANATAGPRQQLDRGFSHFVTYEQMIETHGDGLYRDLAGVSPNRDGWATVVNKEARRLLETVAPDDPWFLWLFYFDPHLMYNPPAPWREVEAQRCWDLYKAYEEGRLTGGQVFSNIGGAASAAVDDCRHLYDAEVAYVDHEIGQLLEHLGATGHLENTLILFTADHGENFGEGGLFFEHGDNAHGAGLRVPMIWRGPGISAGRRDAAVVSLVDVVPTVLSFLGIEADGQDGVAALVSDGVDLSPRLRTGAPSTLPRSRVVFAESASALWNQAFDHIVTGRRGSRVCINSRPHTLCRMPNTDPVVHRLYDHVADPNLENDLSAHHPEIVKALQVMWGNWPVESTRQRVARTHRFKLVQFPVLEGGFDSKLFDIESDPEEERDVKDQHPDVFQHLVQEIERWSEGLSEVPNRVPDAEVEKALRALGYIE